MPHIKDDPSEFTIDEVIDDQKHRLVINVVELGYHLMNQGVVEAEKASAEQIVRAAKAVGRPKQIWEALDDAVVFARVASAMQEADRLGKLAEQRPSSPPSTASSSDQQGLRMTS